MTISQLAAFSLSFMLLALLLVLRGDLLERWQQQLPPDSELFPAQHDRGAGAAGETFLQQHQIKPETYYPIVRVRLTEINQQLATERVHEDDPGGEAVNRELNLTWLADLPDHNPLVAGSWPPKSGEVSMDEGIAGRLKITLGDTLTFSGDTQAFSAKVTSLRQVDWESLKPNFTLSSRRALDGQPQTWLTSFRYDGDGRMLTQLNRQFPTLSLLDIGAILKQVGGVLQQVSRALEVMVVLVVLCGGLLLLAQVQVGMRQRRQELVVYRTLGAGKRLLPHAVVRVRPAGAGGGHRGGGGRRGGAVAAAEPGIRLPVDADAGAVVGAAAGQRAAAVALRRLAGRAPAARPGAVPQL